jgi:hypothetical protein
VRPEVQWSYLEGSRRLVALLAAYVKASTEQRQCTRVKEQPFQGALAVSLALSRGLLWLSLPAPARPLAPGTAQGRLCAPDEAMSEASPGVLLGDGGATRGDETAVEMSDPYLSDASAQGPLTAGLNEAARRAGALKSGIERRQCQPRALTRRWRC